MSHRAKQPTALEQTITGEYRRLLDAMIANKRAMREAQARGDTETTIRLATRDVQLIGAIFDQADRMWPQFRHVVLRYRREIAARHNRLIQMIALAPDNPSDETWDVLFAEGATIINENFATFSRFWDKMESLTESHIKPAKKDRCIVITRTHGDFGPLQDLVTPIAEGK